MPSPGKRQLPQAAPQPSVQFDGKCVRICAKRSRHAPMNCSSNAAVLTDTTCTRSSAISSWLRPGILPGLRGIEQLYEGFSERLAHVCAGLASSQLDRTIAFFFFRRRSSATSRGVREHECRSPVSTAPGATLAGRGAG